MLTHALFALSSILPTGLLSGDTLEPTSVEALVSNLRPGSVLVLGELHDSEEHHRNQVAILDAIAKRRAEDRETFPVSVGFEFFERDTQGDVDLFLSGTLGEEDFLRRVRWSGGRFSLYREQALFPRRTEGRTIALNASRALTSRIAQVGIQGLTEAQRAGLPRGFTLGNALYRERFSGMMEGHIPSAAIDRYFEAQSTWDETMAETAEAFLRENPSHLLVILVGDFHVAFGGGLPDRLRARGLSVTTLSQTQLATRSEAVRNAALLPHPRYGIRADYLWDVP